MKTTKKFFLKTLALSISVFSFINSTIAQEEAEKTLAGLSISGAVDAYYQYNLNKTPFTTSFTGSQNSFSLGMANVIFAKEGAKVGFKADIAFGPRAEGANGYAGTTLAAIKQLYLTYTPTDKLKFTIGNFATHVGYEVIDAPANLNYSTSYMFTNGPFFHTGLKAEYAATDELTLMVGILDDTDAKFDLVKGKHIGTQVAYKKDKIAVFLNYLGGRKSLDTESEIFDNQIDITATLQATEKLGLGLNATTKLLNDKVSDTNASWTGAALYANYKTSDKFTLAARGEYIMDKDGIITAIDDNNILALTLSGNIHIGNFRLVPEFRLDNTSKNGYFTNSDGDDTKTSTGFIFGAIYTF